jgi:hypothetical protein
MKLEITEKNTSANTHKHTKKKKNTDGGSTSFLLSAARVTEVWQIYKRTRRREQRQQRRIVSHTCTGIHLMQDAQGRRLIEEEQYTKRRKQIQRCF